MSFTDEFIARTFELEDNLYRYRHELERDALFVNIHAYKNSVKNFSMKLSDIRYFVDHGEPDRANNELNTLVEMFTKIENLHLIAIHDLSGTVYEYKLICHNING